jgi:hypothetical protein
MDTMFCGPESVHRGALPAQYDELVHLETSGVSDAVIATIIAANQDG